MSLRKVSDLQGLTIADAYAAGLSDNVLNSLIEISYLSTVQTYDADNPPLYRYVSMFTMYRDIRDDLLSAILSSPDGTVTFDSHVHILCGLCLSTNFYMNYELDDDEILNGDRRYDRGTGYEFFVKANQNTLCAIGGDNIFYSTLSNILQADNNFIQDQDGSNIALFNDSYINFYKPVNISGDVHVVGDVHAREFHGVALSAKWADLAELYESDDNYDPGTLVKFGGSKEITIADDEVNAVVTTNPGVILNSSGNSNINNKVGIALTGRTPVKVVGQIRKFDKISLSNLPGIAVSKNKNSQKTIGIALDNKFDDKIGLVECVVKMEF